MALVNVVLPEIHEEPASAARRYIREAERRINQFQITCRAPAFVPSNYLGAYQVLSALSDSTDLRGRQFCEWGSGFGVVAGLAAMLEFDSCGIEAEGVLVDEARLLADDFGLAVEFVHGSFIPRGGERRVHTHGNFSWLTTEGDYAYDELGLDLEDMDLVFAYPWPDEEAITEELFERYAGVGALLATYHGGEDFRVQRKVAQRRNRKSR